MKKNSIILSAVILSSIFLAACNSAQKTDDNQNASNTVLNSSTTPADDILDNDIFAQATTSGNLSRCGDILNKTLQNECKQIVSDRDTLSEAVEAVDLAKCEKVFNDRYRADCEKQVNAKIDDRKADDMRLEISQEALDKGDINICEKLSDRNDKVSCKYNILVNEAIRLKDKSLCDKIGEFYSIEQCRSSFNEIN